MRERPLSTHHRLYNADARQLIEVKDNSIDLIVTSPPYPMIEMWDNAFSLMNKEITGDLILSRPSLAYDLMHQELDKVWTEVARVLKPGSMACINIGDATRTTEEGFRLFTNHARIIQKMVEKGLSTLPNIIWKKPTNAPNKFMGSGMLPAGAYITLEHEYILIFRKGNKRIFSKTEEKRSRKRSAFFWEERNTWFSDTWELKGATQRLADQSRGRSAAYPIEVPHRLINMFSLAGETVLDPFNGTGTTTRAAMENARNSIGYELDSSLMASTKKYLAALSINDLGKRQRERLEAHHEFLENNSGDGLKHFNAYHGFKVKTRQETDLQLLFPIGIEENDDILYVTHE